MSRAALAAGGVALVVAALADLFVTVFNYDGFTFFARRFQAACWAALRLVTAPLPERLRHATLSLGSAAMVPATVMMWLTAEITGFALVYDSGFGHHSFAVSRGLAPGAGSAFYLSAGTISTLTFGDIIGRAGPYRAALDVEAILGLATFTIALGYLVTAFGVLGNLDALHSAVRRHAPDITRPSTLIARFARNGAAGNLSEVWQSLSDKLDEYEKGLTRYPVVYYFHTRDRSRSIPAVFSVLGELLGQARHGLPPGSDVAGDPWLEGLVDQYCVAIELLRRNFVGPVPLRAPRPLPRHDFAASYRSPEAAMPPRGLPPAEHAAPMPGGPVAGDRMPRAVAPGGPVPADWVAAFRELERRARRAAGLDDGPDEDVDAAYERFCAWLPFAFGQRVVIGRVADRLGYRRPVTPPPRAARATADR